MHFPSNFSKSSIYVVLIILRYTCSYALNELYIMQRVLCINHLGQHLVIQTVVNVALVGGVRCASGSEVDWLLLQL